MRFDFAQFVDRLASNRPPTAEHISPYANWTDDELMELLDERIAVFEFDASLSSGEARAEALAWLKAETGAHRFRAFDASTRK